MKGAFARRPLAAFFVSLALLSFPKTTLADVTADIRVKLRPIAEHIPLVTDINTVDGWVYVTTQPGLLIRKSLSTRSTTDWSVVLDIRSKVGMLGDRIPALPGLGYPVAGTYDERGLLGFAADPGFSSNGRFWVWYSAINEHTASPPGFFQWLVSTSQPWDESQWDHVDHVAEYVLNRNGTATFQRMLLNLKRPYFNHTGDQSLAWSPEDGTLILAVGDGGSEYDPNNIAQDDNQISGKLIKIDLDKLRGRDFSGTAPVATFSDLRRLGVPDGAFTSLVKGLRNPSKVHWERANGNGNGEGGRYNKYLANTGQDTIEWVHGFVAYGHNFGFRPWEGIFPTSVETGDSRVIAYGVEAVDLRNHYRPLVAYTHLDKTILPNANTGSSLYTGDGIPGLKGDLVMSDWFSAALHPTQGLLLHATPDRDNLQRQVAVHRLDVDLSAAGLTSGQPLYYTSSNTSADGERLFVGGFKDVQFIVNMRNNAPGSSGIGGALYEVLAR